MIFVTVLKLTPLTLFFIIVGALTSIHINAFFKKGLTCLAIEKKHVANFDLTTDS